MVRCRSSEVGGGNVGDGDGLGEGVGDGDGVGVIVGWTVGLGLSVGRMIGVGLADAEAVGSRVPLALGPTVGVKPGEPKGVGVGPGTAGRLSRMKIAAPTSTISRNASAAAMSGADRLFIRWRPCG